MRPLLEPKHHRLLVIPPIHVGPDAGLASSPSAASPSPHTQAWLRERRLYLERFGRLANPNQEINLVLAAGALPISGCEVLEGIGVLLMDEDAVDRARLESLGARVYEDTFLTLIDPLPARPANEPNRWHLKHLGILDSQGQPRLAKHGSDVLVGIIDTGIDPYHPEFADKPLWFAHFDERGQRSGPPAYDADPLGHGTHVCGLLAGRNYGVAPKAALAVACALNIPSAQGMGCSRTQLAKALDWLLTESFRGPESELGVDLINLSLGIPGYDEFLRDVLHQAWLAGTLAVAAIGNHGQRGANYHNSPGNYDFVLGVGAIDQNGQVAPFSSWGTFPRDSSLIKPDLCAPGVAVWSSIPNGQYAPRDGTSVATPLVSGVAALLIEQSPQLRLDAGELARALQALAVPLPVPSGLGREGRGSLQLT